MTDLATRAWLDQEDMATAEAIRRHGVAIVVVGSTGGCTHPQCCGTNRAARRAREGGARSRRRDDQLFAYTVGLSGSDHPELLVFPDSPEHAHSILNAVARPIMEGDLLLTAGDIVCLHDVGMHAIGAHALVEQVPNPGEIITRANRHYRRPAQASVPALQLSLADSSKLFPGQSGYSGRPQPRPGQFRA